MPPWVYPYRAKVLFRSLSLVPPFPPLVSLFPSSCFPPLFLPLRRSRSRAEVYTPLGHVSVRRNGGGGVVRVYTAVALVVGERGRRRRGSPRRPRRPSGLGGGAVRSAHVGRGIFSHQAPSSAPPLRVVRARRPRAAAVLGIASSSARRPSARRGNQQQQKQPETIIAVVQGSKREDVKERAAAAKVGG